MKKKEDLSRGPLRPGVHLPRPASLPMKDHPRLIGMPVRPGLKERDGFIAAPPIDDDHFDLRELLQSIKRPAERLFFVEHRDDDGRFFH